MHSPAPYTPFLLEMRNQVELATPDFTHWLSAIATASAEDFALMESIEAYASQLERVGQTAEMLGMPGLCAWCGYLNAALMEVVVLEGDARKNAARHLEAWPALMGNYLADPLDIDAAQALVDSLSGMTLSPLLDDVTRAQLITQLVTPPVLPDELMQDVNAEPVALSEADVALDVSEDADINVFQAFMDEAPASLDEFARYTSAIAAGNASTEDIRNAKRIAHSFKGSANIVGIRGIAVLGHYTEDILEYFEKNPVQPPRALGKTLQQASDCLAQMIAYLQGNEAAPEDAYDILSAVVAWGNRIKLGQINEADVITDPLVINEPGEINEPPAISELLITTQPVTAARAPIAAAPAIDDKPGKATLPSESEQANLRVSVKAVDEMFRLSGEMTTKISQLEAQVKALSARAQNLLAQNLTVQQRVLDIEKLVLLRGISLNTSSGADDDSVFDPLEMDRYNELHGATRVLVEATTDARDVATDIEDNIVDLATEIMRQGQIGRDLQYQVISTRMTPVHSLLPRLNRNVRQTCQQTGKEAELVVAGSEIMVDGEVLNKLADPLLHILRNAIDHGIELPEERLQAGKLPIGKIQMRFARQGSTISVSIQDDGRGLDYLRIREKAVARGLINAWQALTQAELARLTLLPGFSTKDTVSEISGRGVGMDVVASRLAELKGTVEINSEAGRGCTIILRFQASLVTQHALLVEATQQIFAIPIHHIVQAIPPNTGSIEMQGEVWKLALREGIYPLRELAVLTGYPSSNPTLAMLEARPKVLVRTEGGHVAVLVDRVIDSRELIVKGMGKYLPRVHGILGATLMGDGAVVPLLNIPELLSEPLAISHAAAELAASARRQVRRVLVVDDSHSVRKSLGQLLTDASFEIATASDGMEAIRMLEKFQPQVICTDLEMPNMNGLELTAHLRQREDTRNIPIIMITSRSMDKHREQAERAGVNFYVTKPYTDVSLLHQINLAFQRVSQASEV